jgi:hypothetical protein
VRVNLAPRLAGAFATVAAVALISGCSMFSEQTTTLQYTPSDGVQGTIGDVDVRNVFVVAESEDSPGTMLGSFVNNGSDDVTVTVVSDSLSQDVDVPAGEVVMLGPDGDQTIEADRVGVVPGRHLRVSFSDGGASEELDVPVLDGSLPEYADLVPTESSS